MSIRSRLLWLLLPPLIFFVILISIFFYFNWYSEIVSSVRAHYTPILNNEGEVIGLMGPDVSLDAIEGKLHNAVLIILFSTITTIALVIISVFIIANKMSRPVQKLKDAALAIAAGNYEEPIQVSGPQEIVDLAHTLNTMSECLQENLSRLKESALVRERMHGEYECSLLLQKLMLHHSIEEFQSDKLELLVLEEHPSSTAQGILVSATSQTNGIIELTLAEAQEKGFLSLYKLLRQSATFLMDHPSLKMSIDCQKNEISYDIHDMPQPLIWSLAKSTWLPITSCPIKISSGDMLFLFNKGFLQHFTEPEESKEWFSRILKHFAVEGFETCIHMLKNDLRFLATHHPHNVNCLIISGQFKGA
jgi:HAMP domain-containing protein